ncbi:hypothetical protein BDN71DRAFT_1438073 [Pleurotus eryngii]|uniref:Uncharacterized protein n=1 Tax=Pleurotus eryngii TaxID=5323 RepID=A0A9P6DEY3_PLEER|nr:hypothetical protein BDN71DRAFT_1438073 [Pleurotus eryngii]
MHLVRLNRLILASTIANSSISITNTFPTVNNSIKMRLTLQVALGQHPRHEPVTLWMALFACQARPAVVEKSACHQPLPKSQHCQLCTVRPLPRIASRKHCPQRLSQ